MRGRSKIDTGSKGAIWVWIYLTIVGVSMKKAVATKKVDTGVRSERLLTCI